jgi:hypothetical protein
MEREGAKPLEGRVARLILLVVVSMMCVVFCVLPSNQWLETTVPFFPDVIYSSFQMTAGRLYVFCSGRNYSGCNLNPLKNIAGQTTVRFFSGHYIPAKSYFYIIITWKKRSSRLWPSVGMIIMTWKKKVQSSPGVGFLQNRQIFTQNWMYWIWM